MLSPANTDINAGTWKPVLLTGPTEFPVAAPAAVTTPGYVAELNEIKGYQLSLSKDQQDKIKYWGAGSVLRWNELMRELVAKYNLPPYQNPDGTYPFPSAAQSAGVPAAVPALSVLALAVNFCATSRPNASPASISLLVAVPAIILDNMASSAFC